MLILTCYFCSEAPKFRSIRDGPYDVNVTEGGSFTLNCNVDTKPEAKIIWLQDGVVLDGK